VDCDYREDGRVLLSGVIYTISIPPPASHTTITKHKSSLTVDVNSEHSQVILALEGLSTNTTSILAFRAVRQFVLCQRTRVIEQFMADGALNARV